MKVIIIDSLIGNDYTINLCKGLQEFVEDWLLILPQNRDAGALPNTKVRLWAPSKDVKVNKFKKSVGYVYYLLRLLTLILSDRNCIVHFQFFRRKSDIYFLGLLRALGVKVVFTAHNVFPHELKPFDRLRTYILYKVSKAIIVHSHFIRKKLIKEFPFCTSKTYIIPHGNFDNYLPEISVARNVARSQMGLSSDDIVLLFFGFIREYKGLDLLIDAFELVAEKDDKIKLVIAGSPINDKLRKKYENKVSNSKYREKIFDFLNFIPSDKIPLYLESSDVLILPYKAIDHSGVIHLAYSFGKPVIATNVGDFPEIIENNKSGRILEKNTASGLADSILELNSQEKLEKMGEYAKYLSVTKYSWKNVSELTVNVYNSLLN